ncbi:MAG TPA: hypothetical protein VEK11_03255 [Thermoanaerobaculia bacterium]|jgi:hypothetical protein|nr:hypothetical protein [Thermoanaerobaculia bacterium]
MKGCARTCVIWLFLWLASAGALFLHLRQFGILNPQIFWACGIAGLLMTMAFAYAFNIATARRERAMLLEAMTGMPPEDGKWVAVSGVIRALNPLRAPLSGTPAVAYAYKINETRRTSKGSSIVTLYEGKALTPATIATRHGGVRLLAVPSLDLPIEQVPYAAAHDRAKAYVQATQFQTSATPKEKRIGMNQESTDDDGNFRVDKCLDATYVNFANCTFEEHLVKQGETICAFGLYSRQRGGLIPHPNWSNQARVMLGNAETVAAKLSARMRKYAIGIVVCGALAYGIVWLYQHAASTSF